MIKKITIEPLKMGRAKSTGKIWPIECRITIESDTGMTHKHVDTLKTGIYGAYLQAQEIIQKENHE